MNRPVARPADLPAPPPGRSGWPWTEAPPPFAGAPLGGASWPTVSVVTPSLNQGDYLEEAIRSVLLQGYPRLEYVVIDGGSTDRSVDIIRRYEPWLDGWVTEPDRGQADAIQKGFERTTGSLLAWLNADDVYCPGAIATVGAARGGQEAGAWLGSVEEIDAGGRSLGTVTQRGLTLRNLVRFWEGRYSWHQPGLFMRRTAYVEAGGLDRGLHFAFDHDLLCRLLAATPIAVADTVVARFRRHASSKTARGPTPFLLELASVSPRYWHLLPRRERRGCALGLLAALTRGAARCFLHGRAGDAARLLRASLRVVPLLASDVASEGRRWPWAARGAKRA